MADEDSAPEDQELGGESDQQLFDAEMARDARNALPILGAVGVLAALVMSTIALINSSGGSSTTTVTVPAQRAAKPTAALSGDALGKQLFVNGDPAVGATSCGSCHTMKAAGTAGKTGPNLDKELTADPASATLESTIHPNKEIATGYHANVMPTNYGTALNKRQLTAIANFVYHSTNLKAKHASAASP